MIQNQLPEAERGSSFHIDESLERNGSVKLTLEIPNVAFFKTWFQVWWPILFAALVSIMQCIVDSSDSPSIDFSKASNILASPKFYVMLVPLTGGCVGLKKFFGEVRLPTLDKGMMVWWVANLLFFFSHCDLLSGYYGVMPGLSDLFMDVSPALSYPQWAPRRVHLDAVYFLELTVEVPLAVFVILLYVYQHPGRYLAENFALGIQLAGTYVYTIPGLIVPETAPSWLRSCEHTSRAIWILFPMLIFGYRFLLTEQEQRSKA
jgi:hypothetical protein